MPGSGPSGPTVKTSAPYWTDTVAVAAVPLPLTVSVPGLPVTLPPPGAINV